MQQQLTVLISKLWWKSLVADSRLDRYVTKMEIICETPRLVLRKVVQEDASALFEILGDSEVMRFSIHGPETPEGVQKFLDATFKRYSRDGFGQWAVIEKASGNLIGECGISVQIIDDTKEYEIGYRFSRQSWGQGMATEAAIACRDFGFTKLKLEKLISLIEAENHQSIRVAEKVGMKLEKESVFHGIPVRIYVLKNPAAERT